MYNIIYKLNEKQTTQYQQFLKDYKNYSLLQTDNWAKFKNNWKNVFIFVEYKNEIKISCSILIRKMPILGYSLLYAPRGPIVKDENYIPEFITALKDLAKKEKAFIFKADPPITHCGNLDKYFHIKSDYKNFEGIQPRFESVLSFKDKKSIDDIFNNLHSKTRYNIRLSERKGVKIRKSQNIENDINYFYELMRETGLRDNFKIRNKEYFYKLVADIKDSSLYIGEYNNKAVAGIITIKHGNSIEYLYGASSNEHRNLMATYLIQWYAIKDAFNQNVENYSFGGISGDLTETNPLYGLYKFKSKFTTDVVEYIGEIQLVFKPNINRLFNLIMKLRSEKWGRKRN